MSMKYNVFIFDCQDKYRWENQMETEIMSASDVGLEHKLINAFHQCVSTSCYYIVV